MAGGAALVGLHRWLSRRNPVWLGAIRLAACIALATALALAQTVPPRGGLIVGDVACVLAMTVIWWAGEDERKSRRTADEPPAEDGTP